MDFIILIILYMFFKCKHPMRIICFRNEEVKSCFVAKNFISPMGPFLTFGIEMLVFSIRLSVHQVIRVASNFYIFL